MRFSVRNNGTTDVADVHVGSFVPAGFARRIDEPNPDLSIVCECAGVKGIGLAGADAASS